MKGQAFVIPQKTLDRCWERAPGYDRENRFFEEDFRELKEAGYLRLAVPTELGGSAGRLPKPPSS